CQLIGQFDAWIGLRAVRAETEVQYLRQHNNAVEVHVPFCLEYVREHCRSSGAIAFAKHIFWRIPASVFSQKLRNEIGKSLRILIDAIKSLFPILTADAAESRSRRIHKDQIAHIQKAVL